MRLDETPFLVTGVTWKRRSYGSVLRRAGRREHVNLNTTATRVIAQIDGRRAARDIAAAEAAACGAARERVEADVARLLARLTAGGWLTTDPAVGRPANDDEVAPPVDHLSIALTHHCNLHCGYCYAPPASPQGELSTAEWRAIIRQLRPFKLFGVILTGGEPTLRTDLWEIVAAINAMDIEVTLVTNGTRIDEGFVEAARAARLGAIQVAVDGPTAAIHDGLRGPGAFEAAWRGITLLQAAGLPVELGCTVVRSTLPHYQDVIRLARRHGLPVSVGEFLPLGPARTQRAEHELTIAELFRFRSQLTTLVYAGVLRQQADAAATFKAAIGAATPGRLTWPRVSSCLGRDAGAHILPDGGVLICPLLNQPELVGGNATREPLRDIWERSPVFERLRATTVEHYATCQRCGNRNLCGGTCRALVMADHAAFAGPPDLSRCFWEQIYYARLGRVTFDTTECLQARLEREDLLI